MAFARELYAFLALLFLLLLGAIPLIASDFADAPAADVDGGLFRSNHWATIRNSMLEKTAIITFSRPQMTRWELAKFVLGRSFTMMVVLLLLESVLTAATTYLIIKAGRDVANDEFLTADLLWILAAQASAYVVGAISWIFAERAGFGALRRHVERERPAEPGEGGQFAGKEDDGEGQGEPEQQQRQGQAPGAAPMAVGMRNRHGKFVSWLSA